MIDPLFALSAAAFLVSLDRAIFAPLLPAIAHDLRGTIGAAGLAVTAYTIPYGACQVFYGPAADRAGKIAVVKWAVLVFAAGTALCAFSPGLAVLDALRAATGGAAAAVIPLSLAYIGDVVPYARRQQTIATLMGVTSLGNALSTAVGGIVADFLSWRALFAFYGVCSLAVTAALFNVRRAPYEAATGETGEGQGNPSALRPAPGWRRYTEVLGIGSAQVLYVLVGLEGFFLQGGFTYLGAFLRERLGLSYLAIGLLLGCYGASTVVASRVLRRIHGRVAEQHLLLGGGLLIAAGYSAIAPVGHWMPFLVAMVALGVGFSFFHSTLQVRATELVPRLRGTSVALFAFALFLGAGIGTAALGLLVSGPPAAADRGYFIMLLICGAGMLLVTLAAWRAPHGSSPESNIPSPA